GGSGLYSLLGDARSVDVYTPFGAPAEPVAVGELGGVRVAFLPRHGVGHRFAPHRVNYRANLWALHTVGVREVLAPCAVGSLDPARGPGTLVVPDQIIDRTWGRAHTYYERESEVVHVGFADPYCPRGRTAALTAANAQRPHAHAHAPRPDTDTVDTPGIVDGGTLVVINGPRFSTRAEAAWHRAAGGTIVGMTTMPEAVLARELSMCFTTLALVTDLDAGLEAEGGVTHAGVFDVFAEHMGTVRATVAGAVARLAASDLPSCTCSATLDGIDVPFRAP
ncbi:MAG: S-methyl-5'-thioadenosine phosphorylase, partial [Micrococcales bacterium]|nr:S-methyl-5'-thioadenosine phosphorylase [Micrococcales bacterium]